MKDIPAAVAVAAKTLQLNRTNKRYQHKRLVEELGLAPKTQNS